MFLTKDEMTALTGYEKPTAQSRGLRENFSVYSRRGRCITIIPALQILGKVSLTGRPLNLPPNTLKLINKNSNFLKDTLFLCQISRIKRTHLR